MIIYCIEESCKKGDDINKYSNHYDEKVVNLYETKRMLRCFGYCVKNGLKYCRLINLQLVVISTGDVELLKCLDPSLYYAWKLELDTPLRTLIIEQALLSNSIAMVEYLGITKDELEEDEDTLNLMLYDKNAKYLDLLRYFGIHSILLQEGPITTENFIAEFEPLEGDGVYLIDYLVKQGRLQLTFELCEQVLGMSKKESYHPEFIKMCFDRYPQLIEIEWIEEFRQIMKYYGDDKMINYVFGPR